MDGLGGCAAGREEGDQESDHAKYNRIGLTGIAAGLGL